MQPKHSKVHFLFNSIQLDHCRLLPSFFSFLFVRHHTAIGKAFAILTDTQKRKHYDMHGPDSFESNATTTSRRSNVYRTNATYGNNYWNDDEFSAEEIFNMFFGAGFGNNAAAHRHHARQHSQQTNFVFTQSVSSDLIFFDFFLR